MKKFFRWCLSLVLCFLLGFSVVGCGNDGQDIDIYMPDGAPALAMSKLMYDNSQFGLDVNYNVVASSNISNYILQKTADLAILPINMASKILNDGQDYKIISTVTNGNLYIVGNQDISSLADLTNQVVGIIGQGNVPDLNFKYLLNSNGISYTQSEEKVDGQVALRYFSDASNLLPLLKQNQLNFGLLPEPAVSKLLSMASNFNVELDIQELWEGGSYPQAVLVAKTDICKNTTLINNMITAMKENELWVINNPSLAVDAVNSHLEEGLVASLQNTISSTAIANCNIKVVCTTEIGEINRMKSYLEKIRSVSSLAIGNYTDNLFYAL